MKDLATYYRNRLTTPENAVARIPKKGKLSFGLGPSNPPALLAALAQLVSVGGIEDLHLYYQLATAAARPLFRVDFLDRLHFHSNFLSEVDRTLIKEAGSSAVIDFMPSCLWQLPTAWSTFNHMDVFMITVSPMDKHGYFSLGTMASALLTNHGKTRDYFGKEKVPQRGKPTIIVPTTSGTGAEVTKHAIFLDREANVKKAVASTNLLPDVAIIDPLLTELPPACHRRLWDRRLLPRRGAVPVQNC